MKPALMVVLLGVLAVLPAAPARAQYDSRESISLNNQIAELRHDLQELREQISRGGGSSSLGGYRSGPAPGAGAGSELTPELLQRVSQLEEEVRRLHGRVDEADNARQRQGEELQKQIGDLNFKLEGLAGSGAKPPVLTPPPAPFANVLPTAPPGVPRRTPELALQEGNAALARRDYAAAEKAAREVLTGPPTPRSVDANFLLARSLEGKRDWAAAALAYDDTFNRAKTGPRAQDALLSQARVLINLNYKKEACQSLDKLRALFPGPRTDLRDEIAATRQRAGCR